VLSLTLQAQEGVPGPKSTDEEDRTPSVRFLFKERPSLRIGKSLRVDFRAKLLGDFRKFPLRDAVRQPTFEFQQSRVGVQGDFLEHLEYEAEAELADGDPRWQDLYLNVRYFRDFQVQFGKFKQPFGRDRLTALDDLTFAFRSRIGSELAPGRDVGVMIHGRVYNRALSYQAGIFRGNGETGGSSGRTMAARLTGAPLRALPAPRWLQSLELGIAVTSSQLPEKLGGLTGETVFGEAFSPRVYVAGQRLRLGFEMGWAAGPFSIEGEFTHARDERSQMGVRANDLPGLIARGWYLGAAWAVTGERKTGGAIQPRRDFLHDGGFGALEFAIRFERLRFGSGEHPGMPATHARAPNIPATSDGVWTSGINWYLNRYLRIQGNIIRERVEGFPGGDAAERRTFWTQVARLQFVI
jgi:phosphate-selective porin OprO/OprP